MRTVRATIVTALNRWIEKSGDNPCRQVKLVREIEGNPILQKIDAWQTPKGVNIGMLATEIEDTARNDAISGNRGGIVEVYGIIPYYGVDLEEGALSRFRISTVVSDDADGESSGVGQYSEGATPRGQTHQGMRHIEGMARIYVDGISRVFGSLETQNQQLMADNRAMASQLSSQRIELEESRDRAVERQLAVYRIYEEEKRNTKLMEGLLSAGPALLNMALGRPILPENSQEQGVQVIKNWASSLSVKQMEELQSVLEPQQYMPVMMIKQQVEDEKEEEEKRKQAAAERETKGIMKDQAVVETMARRDNAGIQRAPLGGDPR